MPRKKTAAEQQEYPSTKNKNARYIEFLSEITPKEPLDYSDVKEMERRFAHYLAVCANFDMKVGNLTAYYAIGIDRKTAYNWVHRVQNNPERQAFIEKVQAVCGTYREFLMQDGQINPVTGIFWQKNFDEFRDQQEIVAVQQPVLGELTDMTRLQQKYLDNASHAELDEPKKAIPEKGQKG